MTYQSKIVKAAGEVKGNQLPGLADATIKRFIKEKQGDTDFWSPIDRCRSDSAHKVFQYPAMMVPVVQRRLLEAVTAAIPTIESLYDPFMGSGTSLVSGMHLGLSVYGNDINPLAVLLSRLRTARKIDDDIRHKISQMLDRARKDASVTIETRLANYEKWFKQDVAVELSKLRRSISREGSLWARQFMWSTLAETIRLTSNDRTSTYKLHMRSVEEIAQRKLSPLKVFEVLASENCLAFFEFRKALEDRGFIKDSRYVSCTDVRHADTREASQLNWENKSQFELMMTSPPYGDNITTVTYGQHSYLPLNWIDLEDIDSSITDSWLRTTHEIDELSLGGAKAPQGRSNAESTLAQSSTLRQCWESLPEKGGDGRRRLVRFYADICAALDAMLGLMSVGAYLIWTVGNRNISGKVVPTDQIILDLLEQRGCTFVGQLERDIRHKRMPTRNSMSATMKKEHILIMRMVRR